jgi:hypothetical protein
MVDEKQEKKGSGLFGPSIKDVYAKLEELGKRIDTYKSDDSRASEELRKELAELRSSYAKIEEELKLYNQGVTDKLNALEGVVKYLDVGPAVEQKIKLEEAISNLNKQYKERKAECEDKIKSYEKVIVGLEQKIAGLEDKKKKKEEELKEAEKIWNAIFKEYKTFPDALYGDPNIKFRPMWARLCMMEWHEINVKHIAFASFCRNILLDTLEVAFQQVSLDKKKKIIKTLYDAYETWGVARITHPRYLDCLIEENVGISPEDEDRMKKQQEIFNKFPSELERYLKSPDEEMIKKEANELAGIFEEKLKKLKKLDSITTRVFIDAFQEMLKEEKFEDKLRVLVPIGKAFKEWLDIGSTYPINR